MPHPTSDRAVARGWVAAAALFAALLPVLFHLRFFTGARILYPADTAQLQFPRYKILCDALQREGGLASWQTWLYAGSPFHANPEHPTLYPPVVLLARFCSPVWTMHLTILVHLALAGVGMFFLVRRLWTRIDPRSSATGAGIGGALVGACVFSLSLTTRHDHLNLVAYGATHALIPWVLLAADSLLNGPRPRRAAGLLGLGIAFLVLSGGLYVIPYAAFGLATWMVALGLFGGRERARRTLTWGLLAAVVALVIVSAKLLPYREWVATTNRAGELSYAEAIGTTLGGSGSFTWSEVWKKVSWYTFYGTTLVLALLAIPLWRSGAVRVAFALVLLCFAIALGGPVHRAMYEVVPLFDQTRSAVRAWSGVNAFLPVLAGLGACWLLARSARLRERPAATIALGAAWAAVLAPFLCYSFRFDQALRNPERVDDILARYTWWPEAARRGGTQWRAMYVDHVVPQDRNEQFVSTALEVETPAGYLGHVWPVALERHLYGPPTSRIADGTRFRRRSTLSVRWMVSTVPDAPPNPHVAEIVPANVDGNRLVENPLARARAFLPSVVIAVHDDTDSDVAYGLLDPGSFPLLEASILQLDRARLLSPGELASLDALVLRGEPSSHALLAAQAMQAAGKPVIEVGASLSDDDRRELATLLAEVVRLAEQRAPSPASFRRVASDTTEVERADPARPGWVVISEPWSLYGGWKAEGRTGDPLTIDRADGVSSAVFLPGGESTVRAVYAPRTVTIGLWLYLLGVLAGLALAFWPERRAGT